MSLLREHCRSIQVPADGEFLAGELVVPSGAEGLVIFAHGSGSSHLSPRNRFVAQSLRGCGNGTLLVDLLSRREEEMDQRTGYLRFDIPFLSERLCMLTEWALRQSELSELRLGYFGSSTGAAAALKASVENGQPIEAIVSRGGRVDLADDVLWRVEAPTLLIVGELDYDVLALNRQALTVMRCEKELAIVPGATHLFEETGALEQVARLASDWFDRRLRQDD
jgi:pimeloyl-ACP methyl ester carboxylesterase